MDPSETFSQKVKRFDLEFTGLLIGLLKRITDVAFVNPSDKFINLVHRFVIIFFFSGFQIVLSLIFCFSESTLIPITVINWKIFVLKIQW